MIGTWHNNIISKKLNEEYPRDFSIHDIDGVCRCNYTDDEGESKIRLIIYESKYEKEKIGKEQLQTLRLINESMNWDEFDDKSGVFIIRVPDDNVGYMKIYSIYNELLYEYTMDEFHDFISVDEFKPIKWKI
jgi:hypothetical protein